MNKIILIGFACCGKSSVGKILADKLNSAFVDTDSAIEKRANLTISEIFDLYGEKHFRQLESELLRSLDGTNAVVSCGGGSVLADGFSQFAENNLVVWLTASAQTVMSRLGNAPRPLFDSLSVQQLEENMRRRSSIYRGYAQAEFSTDGKTPQQVAEEIYNYIVSKK